MLKLATATAAICLISIGPASAISLKRAVEKAISTHPSVLAAAARKRARDARINQANSKLFPTVSVDGDVGYEKIDKPGTFSTATNNRWRNRKQLNLSVKYVIFDGLERANRIYYSAAQADAASRRVMVQAEEIALDAVEAYIDHRRHRFLVHIATQNIQAHQRILRLARARVSGGKATTSEVDVVRERLYAAQAAREEVIKASLEADARFKSIIGQKPGKTHRVAWPKGMPRSRSAAVAQAIQHHPEIAAAAAEADAHGFDVERLKGINLPEVALEGSASVGEDVAGSPGRNNSLQALLKLRWTVFDGNLRKHERSEASAKQAEARHKRDLEIRNLSEKIESSWAAIVTGARRNNRLERQSVTARSVSASYRKEYQASKRGLLEVLEAENSVFNSRFESVSAAGVHLFNAYRLKALTGTLVSSLGLQAPAHARANYRARIPSNRSGFNITIQPLRTD
ncbi:MAG: TolC family protein [Pseudomonadota bacterium]